MRARGLDPLFTADQLAMVGFVEVLRHLPFMLRVMRRVTRFILEWRPERVILIDYPGFNLRLARRLHTAGIKVTYYISPQLWAWREKRVETIRQCVDQMLVIFPFEVDWYRRRGVAARFVGHPIMEEPEPDVPRRDYFRSLGLNPDRPVLTLYPGSRSQEVQRHLAVFHAAAGLVRHELPQVQVVLGLSRGLPRDIVPPAIRGDLVVAEERPRLALRYADAAIVASGTSTLEAAVWGIPMAVVYRMAPLSWWIGRKLVKLDRIGMVNILAGEEVCPEFLQERAQPAPIARAICRYFQDPNQKALVQEKLDLVRQSLAVGDGQAGAGNGAAQPLKPSELTAGEILSPS
jgi:lipid-A-disaccharide synthase